jgi:hypothetical protein
MVLFLTDNQEPVKVDTYPAIVALPVDGNAAWPLFIERRYYDRAGVLLEVLADQLPAGAYGAVPVFNLNDDYLLAADSFEVLISDVNNHAPAASVNRVDHAFIPEPVPAPMFLTEFTDPVLFVGYPSFAGLLMDSEAVAPAYAERRYLAQDFSELEIKASTINAGFYGGPVHLTLKDAVLHCAEYLELTVRDDYRAYNGACPGGVPPVTGATLEYEALEYNELEYN